MKIHGTKVIIKKLYFHRLNLRAITYSRKTWYYHYQKRDKKMFSNRVRPFSIEISSSVSLYNKTAQNFFFYNNTFNYCYTYI